MVNLSVCIGSACHVKGSYNVINAFQQSIEQYNLSDKVGLKAVFCLGHCSDAVSVKIDDGEVFSVSGLTAKSFFKKEVLPRVK
ncbi:(2Fe-2S) ferredoxin domain-containing protein [Clostridium sp. UBA4395]|uniref:(2Fe-2S) ferredoxin domain-containing protein n=1 Tax=Clostridium sp. UBA4395 TaxID=1946360 RepID=UPI003216C7C2